MLLITHAARGWRTEERRVEFRAAPGPGQFSPIVPTGVPIWTPPVRALVRAVTASVDLGDVLVAAGGATVCGVGGTTGAALATQQFIANTATATWNSAGGRAFGWGNSGPSGASLGSTVFQDGGILMWPANGFFPGETMAERAISPHCDAGSYTGTLLFVIQWRPV